jgi:superfamily II helicase
MTYRLLKKEIAYRKIGDEFFVLTTRDSMLHNIKGAGVRMVELLDEGKDPAEIVRLLCEEYDIPAVAVAEDLASFLQELVAKGIVAENST